MNSTNKNYYYRYDFRICLYLNKYLKYLNKTILKITIQTNLLTKLRTPPFKRNLNEKDENKTLKRRS